MYDMSIITIILFLLILTVLVFVHELGHFMVAKWTGMKVEEFSIGFFEPRLFVKKIGDTEYSIRPFLLGGYVKIYGENDVDGTAANDTRAFNNRPYLAKMATLVAGVTMNLILAYVLFVVLSFGTTTVATDDARFVGRMENRRMVILEVLPDSPAGKSNIAPGAVLLSVVARGEKAPLTDPASTVAFINRHENDAITITYRNPGVSNEASTTLALVYGVLPEDKDKKALGVSLEQIADVHVGLRESFTLAGTQLMTYTKMTFSGLGQLVSQTIHGNNVLNSLSGPIGIASMVGQARTLGYESVLLLTAFLSLNLAVLNILPLPALDGGQMVRVTIEAVIRRRLQGVVANWINIISFALLITLLLVVSIHDVIKLF